MRAQDVKKPNFGNWVPVKMIAGPGVLGAIFLLLAAVHWAFLIPSVLCLAVMAYFAIARYLFSAGGGNVQDRVQELVVDRIQWTGMGKALDIGCGNGPLTLKIARCFPDMQVVGMDYWGKNWDYSVQVCQANARLAGVAERVSFEHGSASALPFKDAEFDLVVSNLTFHEVRDVADKRQCIHEALRVLKPGGVFVLQDLFLLSSLYGTPEKLVETVRGWGGRDVKFIRTRDEDFIPTLVKLPFMVGALAILSGSKKT